MKNYFFPLFIEHQIVFYRNIEKRRQKQLSIDNDYNDDDDNDEDGNGTTSRESQF